MSEVCNFPDEYTLHSSNKELEVAFRNLETDLNNVLAWFNINSLKANPGNFQNSRNKIKRLFGFKCRQKQN